MFFNNLFLHANDQRLPDSNYAHEELTEKQNYDKLKFDFLVNRKEYKYKGETDGRSSFKEFYRENY